MELDERKCCRCINSKPRTDFEIGSFWYCAKHKIFITDLTRADWILGCKGKDFKTA